MTRFRLAYTRSFKDRHGKVRHYFRRAGHKEVPLPGLPGSAEFMAVYQAALAGQPLPIGASRAARGTISALIASWYASADFRQLAPNTRRAYRSVLERFRAEHGDKRVAHLRTQDVKRLIGRLVATPAQANRLRSLLRLLMRHALEDGWRADDPTLGVRKVKYKKKPFPTWSEGDIEKYEARWPTGTRARLALALMLYTGQRRSDVIRMGRQHVRDGRIRVVQRKTGAELSIPLHPALSQVIEACPADNLTFLLTEAGRPFASGNGFYNRFINWARAAAVEKGLGPHGLRKAATRRLLEAGCTHHEVMAITGHKSLAEMQKYAEAVEQPRLAASAIARIGSRRPTPDGA